MRIELQVPRLQGCGRQHLPPIYLPICPPIIKVHCMHACCCRGCWGCLRQRSLPTTTRVRECVRAPQCPKPPQSYSATRDPQERLPAARDQDAMKLYVTSLEAHVVAVFKVV